MNRTYNRSNFKVKLLKEVLAVCPIQPLNISEEHVYTYDANEVDQYISRIKKIVAASQV